MIIEFINQFVNQYILNQFVLMALGEIGGRKWEGNWVGLVLVLIVCISITRILVNFVYVFTDSVYVRKEPLRNRDVRYSTVFQDAPVGYGLEWFNWLWQRLI